MNTNEDLTIEDRANVFVPHGRFVIRQKSEGPLQGLTFVVKDLFDVAGHPTGAGNPRWLATHDIPLTSSPVVDSLLQSGATLVGKTITDELAYSLHGDNIHYGSPINTYAPDRVTGGSSSGSVAAVAARMVDFALGTDTGGSTRVPASYCGVWGLRPTHGILSSRGLVPLHPSYDTPTWMAHEASTFEKVGEILLPFSDFKPGMILQFDDALDLADECFKEPARQIRQALEEVAGVECAGQRITEDATLHDWRNVYATSGAYEGWQIHGDWIARAQPEFAEAIAARWKAASLVTAESAAAARVQAATIRERVRSILGTDGVAILPSASSFAPFRNADPADVDATRLRTMAITCIAGLSGLPQVSIPFRLNGSAPLGISIIGPANSDMALIRLAIKVHDYTRKKADGVT